MSVDFDPVSIGPPGHRVDPVVVGVIIVLVVLLVAIIKPWDSGPAEGDTAAASASPTTTPSGSPGGAGANLDRPSASPERTIVPPISWSDVAEVVSPHDGWGVRGILAGGQAGLSLASPTGYSDRWRATPLGDRGHGFAVLDRDERSMVMLGVTVPPAAAARDARVWRLYRDVGLVWVDTVQVDPDRSGVSFLFTRPGTDGQPYTGWLPGTYRIDVLTADSIEQILVGIPSRFGDVPPPDFWSATDGQREGPPVPALSTADLYGEVDGVVEGMFATVDGSAVPLHATADRPLSEHDAWLDSAVDGGRIVASAYLPRATGLGVILSPGDDITGSSIRRLAPDVPFDPPRPLNGMSDRQGGMLYVVYPSPDGVWEAGTYAVTVDWTDGSGDHQRTWHVELRPGLS